MQKILFLNRQEWLDAMLHQLGDNQDLVALQNKSRNNRKLKNVRIIPVSYRTLGIPYLANRLIGKQTSVPVYIKHLQSILTEEKPDIIVAFDLYHFSFLQALAYKKSHPGVRLVMFSETKQWPENLVASWLFSFFWTRFKQSRDLVEFVALFTSHGKKFYQQNMPDMPIMLLPVPVDTELFYPISAKAWLPDNTLRIIMNARYESYKRHEDLLTALNVIREQGKQFRLTCIGRADSGQNKIEQRVKELGLQEVVTFLKPVPQNELAHIYHQHDVLVLPSYNEAIGMVVPEAMACGIPTITSDTVGANVYVENEATGLIYPTGDVDSLVNAIKNMFDKKNLETLSQNARLRIESEFSARQCQKRFNQIFD